MYNANSFFSIFNDCIIYYHQTKDIQFRVDQVFQNPFPENSLENYLFKKNFIDNVQWDLEDMIRDPGINPEKALQLKRRIDRSNQERTDMVEKMDDFFLEEFKEIIPQKDAKLNTESLAWAIDRLSILALKIYHMQIQGERKDAGDEHRQKCTAKLQILQTQRHDLVQAIDELMKDIEQGTRIFKVYRQMKMYNDPSLNPVLYEIKNKT